MVASKLEFRKRKTGRSASEWSKLCQDHFGWSCLIDGKKYTILANGVVALDIPYGPGEHRKCLLFYHWCKKALAEEAEWKIEQWQASLIPPSETDSEEISLEQFRERQKRISSGEDVIANVVRSTSEPSKSLLESTDFPPPKVANTLSEVLDPGMCVSVLKVFQYESNARDESPKDSSEPLPETLPKETSSGTPCGQIEIPNLPF